MRAITMLLLSTLFLLSQAPGSDAASRPCRPAKKGERFQVDFNEVPLRTVARLVSCAAGWNLIFQPPALAKRRVNVVAPRPVRLKSLVRLFHALLRSHGLHVRRAGGYRIVEPR